jgi:hypothetical protein
VLHFPRRPLKRMSYHLIWLYRYLWIVPHVLLVAVAVAMYRKGLHKHFPIFFSYLIFEFVMCCILWPMAYFRAPGEIYGRFDLFDRAGDIALRFGILQELFESSAAGSAQWHRDVARMRNRVTVLFAILTSMFFAGLYSSRLDHVFIRNYVIIEAFNVAQCGLIVLLFLWHRFLGLRMSPFAFGIAVGMGLAMGLEPFEIVLRYSIPERMAMVVDMMNMTAYHAGVLVWLYFSLAREKVTSAPTTALPQLIEQAADMGRIAHL